MSNGNFSIVDSLMCMYVFILFFILLSSLMYNNATYVQNNKQRNISNNWYRVQTEVFASKTQLYRITRSYKVVTSYNYLNKRHQTCTTIKYLIEHTKLHSPIHSMVVVVRGGLKALVVMFCGTPWPPSRHAPVVTSKSNMPYVSF